MKMTSRGLLLLMGLVASTGLVREAGAQGITFQTTNLTLVTRPGAMISPSMSPTTARLKRHGVCAIYTRSPPTGAL